jgi:hypothetical protein
MGLMVHGNSEGVAMPLRLASATQPFQGATKTKITSRAQGCQSATPGLEFANTFGVINFF